jgi:hypothetical protein
VLGNSSPVGFEPTCLGANPSAASNLRVMFSDGNKTPRFYRGCLKKSTRNSSLIATRS